MKRLVILMAVVLSLTFTAVPAWHYAGPNSSSGISLQQSQAEAQVDAGLLYLSIYYGWYSFWATMIGFGIAYAFNWAWGAIGSLFSGRPDVGPNSATGCDADFFASSRNNEVRNLGSDFVVLQHYGYSLSNFYSYKFTQAAANFCSDMENWCGYQLGSYVCQKYLQLAGSYKNACSNFTALSLEHYLDTAYPQCSH